jgi:hypothetical protein
MGRRTKDHQWRFTAPRETEVLQTERRGRLTRNEYQRRLRAYLATCPGANDRMGFFGAMGWHAAHEGRFRAMVGYVAPTSEADWLEELEDIAQHNPEEVLRCEAYQRLQRLNPALRGLSAEATVVVRAAESAFYGHPEIAPDVRFGESQ